jgi:hypothetical protein
MRRLLLLSAVLWGTAALASESYHPPEGGAWQKATLYLTPVGPLGQASGVAVFSCNLAETQHRYQFYGKNVRAGALCTVWLVDMEGTKVRRTHELTSRWRPLRADRRGVLYHIANLPWCPLGRGVLVVKYHPNDRARGFGDGITVLKGHMAKMK